jgi:hypothetical protein
MGILEDMNLIKLLPDSSNAAGGYIAFIHPPLNKPLMIFGNEQERLLESVYENLIFQFYTEGSLSSKNRVRLDLTEVRYFCPRCLNYYEEPRLLKFQNLSQEKI